jgi:hypothetical protein
MEQSPSWKANGSSARQGIPRILYNPNIHYRIHKRPLPVPVLSQLNLKSHVPFPLLVSYPKYQSKSEALWNVS